MLVFTIDFLISYSALWTTSKEQLNPLSLITNLLLQIKKDPINNLTVGETVTPGNLVRDYAEILLQSSDKENFKVAARTLVWHVFELLNAMKRIDKNSEMQSFYRNIHLYTTNNNNFLLWKGLTLVVSDNTVSSLVHSLTMGVVREIVAIENKSVAPDAPSSDDLRLTKDEQEVLSYVAGYIVASLRKRYFRLQKSKRQETKEAALAAIKLLNSLHSKGTDVITSNSFLEFTRKWTEIQNRGG